VRGLSDDEDDGALKPLPERLVMELTAHRTLALREAIGRSPDVALTLLLMKLVTDTFRTSSGASGSCFEASVRTVYMSAQAPDLKDSVVAKPSTSVTLPGRPICRLATMPRSGTI
jgi:ParB family chromosome partitioning protein